MMYFGIYSLSEERSVNSGGLTTCRGYLQDYCPTAAKLYNPEEELCLTIYNYGELEHFEANVHILDSLLSVLKIDHVVEYWALDEKRMAISMPTLALRNTFINNLYTFFTKALCLIDGVIPELDDKSLEAHEEQLYAVVRAIFRSDKLSTEQGYLRSQNDGLAVVSLFKYLHLTNYQNDAGLMGNPVDFTKSRLGVYTHGDGISSFLNNLQYPCSYQHWYAEFIRNLLKDMGYASYQDYFETFHNEKKAA